MKDTLISILRSPVSGQKLHLADGTSPDPESGWLVTEDGQHRHEIRGGIPRFVPASNYADNFGMQWNHFARTQLDSHSGHAISAERFWGATGWLASDMAGKWVLDIGCGAGRFAEIALSSGANVVALDYSSAVDACLANLRQHPRLHVVQGDAFALPFSPGSFDFVYSLGVLQHTPDPQRAFASLPPMLAPGGRISVDYYERSLGALLHPKYLLRPVTKRMPKPVLFSALEALVPVLLPLSRMAGRVPLLGRGLQRMLPVANDEGTLPLTPTQLREWSLLDTFDWLAPEYDNPQSEATARQWMVQAGLAQIEVLRVGHLVARGVKPS